MGLTIEVCSSCAHSRSGFDVSAHREQRTSDLCADLLLAPGAASHLRGHEGPASVGYLD